MNIMGRVYREDDYYYYKRVGNELIVGDQVRVYCTYSQLVIGLVIRVDSCRNPNTGKVIDQVIVNHPPVRGSSGQGVCFSKSDFGEYISDNGFRLEGLYE